MTRKKTSKTSFWEQFGVGVASSIVASLIVAFYLGSQINALRSEIKVLEAKVE